MPCPYVCAKSMKDTQVFQVKRLFWYKNVSAIFNLTLQDLLMRLKFKEIIFYISNHGFD